MSLPKLLSLVPRIIALALDLRGAAMSRHTRTQIAANAITITLAAVIIAALSVTGVLTLPYDLAVNATLLVALTLAPFVARGLGATLIQPAGPPSQPESTGISEILLDIQQDAEIKPPDETDIIAVRQDDEAVWYALTHPLDIDTARLVAQYGYTLQGVEYDLATGKPTGRTVKVPPSVRKRWGAE